MRSDTGAGQRRRRTIDPVRIEDRTIGAGAPPYIVAELSANHGGVIERALRIVELAAEAGADAIKFQAYTAESLTLDCDTEGFTIESDGPWNNRSLFDLYREAATPYDWFPELYARARKCGITPFTSPFSTDVLDMLESLGSPAYKIASFEAVDHDLIASCAATGKPLIISTGLCRLDEIEEAVAVARDNGCKEIILLKCNSAYPARFEEANLLGIPALSEHFDLPVGYSDHSLGICAPIAACALGACMIEKHFIDAREPSTADSRFSAVPSELREIVAQCRNAYAARGRVSFGPTDQERPSLVFRRSLYATRDIAAGEAFTNDNVRSIRPGYGLKPKHLPEVLNKRARRALKRGEPLDWDVVS